MKEINLIQSDYEMTKNLLNDFKQALAIWTTRDEYNKDSIQLTHGYIVNNIFEHQFKLEDMLLADLDNEKFGEIIGQIIRLKGLSHTYFKCFVHYWKCYEDGNTLAKYDAVSYGDSCRTALLERMKLAEKLIAYIENIKMYSI
ncbi:MAG: hypothetical protein ACRCSG_09270 [Cellulosilyticaceae bacterium]